MSKGILDLLVRYPWRGNVRELENCIEKVEVLSQGEEFTEEHLPINIKVFQKEQAAAGKGLESLEELAGKVVEKAFESPHEEATIYRKIMHEIERRLIEKALAETGNKKTKAAKLLGINRNTLHKKVTELGIRVK